MTSASTTTTKATFTSPSKQQKQQHALRRVWIVTQGSRGDVQPYIPLAMELQKRNIQVRFYCNDDFVPMAQRYLTKPKQPKRDNDENKNESENEDEKEDGFENVVSCGISVEHEFRTNPALKDAIMTGRLFKLAKEITRTTRENAPKIARVFHSDLTNKYIPDLVIITPLIRYIGYHLALNYRVPFVEVSCQAMIYNPNAMIFGLPTLPFGLHFYLMQFFIGSSHNMVSEIDNQPPWDHSNIIARFNRQQFVDSIFQPQIPILVLMPQIIANVAYHNPSPMYRFIGTPVLHSNCHKQQTNQQQPDQQTNDDVDDVDDTLRRISEFSEQQQHTDGRPCPKPIYLGFGSMISKSRRYMTELCIRTLYYTKQRGIVFGGWADLSLDAVLTSTSDEAETSSSTILEPELMEYAQQNILFVRSSNVSHEWLFPQVALTVHHGGIGTTTASLRAGIPTIITPVFGDQYDNSRLINQLQVGIGFPKQLQNLTWKDLGNAILQVLSNPDMQVRAKSLGQQLRQSNDNQLSVDALIGYWNEYCITGRFFELFPGEENKDGGKQGILMSIVSSATTTRSILTLGIVGATVAAAITYCLLLRR